MRAIIVGVLTGGTLLSSLVAASAAPIGGSTLSQAADSQAVVTRVQSWRRYCDSLRRACLYKEELGEQGQGNCRTYRSQCRGQYGEGSGRHRTGGYEYYGEPGSRRYRAWEY